MDTITITVQVSVNDHHNCQPFVQLAIDPTIDFKRSQVNLNNFMTESLY